MEVTTTCDFHYFMATSTPIKWPLQSTLLRKALNLNALTKLYKAKMTYLSELDQIILNKEGK